MLIKLREATNLEDAMTKDKTLKIAQEYMINRGVEIVLPGEIGEVNGDKVEVIFLNPLSLEPDTIVCPPDNRVWVNTKTGEVTWIEQM